ncbi:MAG: hypothetical protein M1827_000079 [Pycnora praestabilis]|nr:MAG: hypothetical protein M1827_000079 [Pycnora praestabilis]
MNGTPRLRSAYPPTPRSSQKVDAQNGRPGEGKGVATNLPNIPLSHSQDGETTVPLIPFEILDAPTQRLYVLALYVGFHAWRSYDYYQLVASDTDSLWLFLKWAVIDGVFLFNLPIMGIPRLEWSFSTICGVFVIHALLDGLLMFRIPIPLEAWLIGLMKMMYDSELSVSERRVKPANILHNSSLILGKQIIHILPEGSAMLNPHNAPFCLDSSQTSVNLPIYINQSSPILIELLRIDFDTNENETISISSKQARNLKKQADRGHTKGDLTSPRVLSYPVKKTGLYRLQKVVDESKLEVQRRLSDTLVVACPRASVNSVEINKCRGELSDLILEVQGTPPLKIKYSRTINRKDRGFFFQSIQPENLFSPLTQQRTSGALATQENIDVSWARSQIINVPLNESLNPSGGWLYSIDEVHDACGNIANYSSRNDDGDHLFAKASHLEQAFTVHERPRVALHGCDPQHPLKVAKGQSAMLPVEFGLTERGETRDASYTVSYLFTPLSKLRSNEEHASDALVREFSIRNAHQKPEIKEPGLYSLRSVSSRYCGGEVLEPSTCLLYNPPEPDLSIMAEKISDKCAGTSVGLMVDLDLIGTPPFKVMYEVQRSNKKQVQVKYVEVERLRGQLELKPSEASHYVYRFLDISDAVYKSHSLKHKNLILEQDVKPPASAHFIDDRTKKEACIEEPVSFNVRFQGEAPWHLEYELVYGGKRTKYDIDGIENEVHTITTEKLLNGGEYSLSLASVTDRSGCRVFLEEEARINVRRQRPKAAFGQLEGKRTTMTLEGKKINLPLRLTGQSPWNLRFRNINDTSAAVMVKQCQYNNDVLEVASQGIYEIVDIRDAVCPGSVDVLAKTFDVAWIPRPRIGISQSTVVERVGESFMKREVCEGDEDAVELILSGTQDAAGLQIDRTPPYHVRYEQHLKPEIGSVSLSNKEFTAGLGVASIRMDTSKAGLHEYKFCELGDYLYDHDPRKYTPLAIQQRVNSKPSARFTNTGKTYSYCKDEQASDEVIPISLTGVPPFYLEIGIKHHMTARPEVVTIPNIESKSYEFRIPHRARALGNHLISVRKVRDGRGCQRKTEFDAPHVQVTVSEIPTISPLESQHDYCVGDRVSYALSGTAPFNVYYTFEGVDRKATATTTSFKRITEKPGNFTITAVSDGASGECRAHVNITKMIHEMPSVKISKGKESVVDIHEGGETEILFEFWGTPPFEFTYTRSTNARKGRKSQVLETRHDVSYEHTKLVRASEEGTYEVVAIKDKFCAFSTQRVEAKSGQKLLQF